MAVLTGVALATPGYTYLASAGTSGSVGRAGYAAAALGAGSVTSNQPITVAASAVTGVLCGSYGSRFFTGVYVIPSSVNLGQMLAQQTRTVEVWNARDSAISLDALTGVGVDGDTFEGPAAPPTTFAAKESRIYTLTVGMAGAANISTVWTLSFDSGDAPTFSVIGSRLVTFAFPADWSTQPTEAFTWSSDVHEAWDGTEQRVALVENPRRELEYALLATEAQARLLVSSLHGWMGRRFLVPWWPDGATLAAPLAAGAPGVAADTALCSMVAGGFAVLWRSPSYYESIGVTAAAGGYVTFERPTTKAFAAGDQIFPARLCYLGGSQPVNYVTDAVAKAVVRFRESVGLAPGYAGGTAPPQHDGRDVFMPKPDWTDGYPQEITRGLTVDDFGLGAFQERPRTTTPRVTTPMSILLTSRQDVADLIAFLANRRGRVHPFWCPSRVADLRLLVDMGPSETVMVVENCGYTNLVGVSSTVRRNVSIRLGNETYIRKRVVSCAVDVADTTRELLTLDSAVGVQVNVADVVSISFLEPCRLDQDRVELSWVTDSIATSSLSRVAVPEVEA